jgi:lysozyme
MTFNLGGTRFGKFNNMWSAVVEGDWKRMAVEMEDSRWFKQVGRRSIELQESVLSV